MIDALLKYIWKNYFPICLPYRQLTIVETCFRKDMFQVRTVGVVYS